MCRDNLGGPVLSGLWLAVVRHSRSAASQSARPFVERTRALLVGTMLVQLSPVHLYPRILRAICKDTIRSGTHPGRSGAQHTALHMMAAHRRPSEEGFRDNSFSSHSSVLPI